MKHKLITLTILVTAALAHAADPSINSKSVVDLQDGVWKPVAGVLGGARLPQPALDAITLKVSGANYEVSVTGEKEPDKGSRTLDESTTPKRITLNSTNGPNKGKTFLGIYEMKDANSMRVCYDLSGTQFPKEFKAPKGTQLYLVDYRRYVDAKPATPKGER